MLILLVVLWLLGVLARDDSRKENQYVIKRITSCPDVGYFFRREASPNALDSNVCYLCFCQNDGTAVCWQRENRRCDVAHYQHGVGKRDTRVRRSPIGLSDIFFRDAARDLFNKQMPETCKPYETSFSEGCPPADWCTGCTVCDCDAHGRWDCHILSFCPDKKDKNKLKKSKKRLRSGIPTRSTPGVPKRTTNKKPPNRTPAPKQTTVPNNQTTKKQVKNKVLNVSPAKPPNKNIKQIKKMKQKSNRNLRKNNNNASPKPLIINKEAMSKNPTIVNSEKLSQLNLNDTDKITQEVFKKVFSAMQTFLDKRISAIQPKTTVKSVKKRSMVKRSTQNIKNSKNAKKKVNGQFQSITNKKKYIRSSGPKNNNQKKINNAKNPFKANKKGVTTKKPNNPTKTSGKRIKRDISNYNITETVVVENSSYRNMDVLTTVPSKLTIPEDTPKSNETETNSYYKYSIITPMIAIVTENPEEYQIVYALGKNKTKYYNITHEHKKREKENMFDEIQGIVQNSSFADNKNNSISEQQQTSDQKAKPEFNDLKFTDWPQVKLLKISLLSKDQTKTNSTNSVSNSINRTEVNNDLTIKKHLKAKDVARIVSPPSRKYNRSKIINTLSCNTINTSKRNHGNLGERIYHKISDLQNVLKRALGEFRKNNTTQIKQKRRRFNVIKYLKTFLSKVFKRNRSKETNAINEQIELNSHIIDSICESFNNCDMTQKNNIQLREKISELNGESHKIIRTIKIIKGLLHLLDVPMNTKFSDDQKLNFNTGKSNLKEDISKLNAVLKDKYNTPLTSTQMTQIRYIKDNTQLFVQSVGKFASVLNDIITILTKKHNIIEEKSKIAFKTAKRSYENNEKPKNYTARDFKRLKGLLIKYNMIQNTFVRKIYNMLSKFEKLHENDINTKVSNESKVRTATIELFSRNIISNLRKLKNLAKTLNSRRQKREARDDDTMEYLLTLMEYLLKQNYPLDAAPVNDGIDLLIEAIKSAPDIKPIKKKVLQSLPANIRISRTTEPTSNILKDDSSSDSRRVGEDSASNDTRLETGEQSSYQEMEKDDNFKYKPGKNIFESDEPVNTDVNNDKEKLLVNANQIDSTVKPGASGIFGNIQETTEHNNFKKFENIVKENIKKFELFNSEVDDEDVDVTNSTIASDAEAETDYAVTVTVPLKTTEPKLPDVKSTENHINSVDVSGSSDGEKRVGLDWLDEGYEDSKEVKQMKTTRKTQAQTQTAAPVIATIKTIQIENVSSVTKEIRDEEEKKRKAKIDVEDVMFKKQMDLLNSLDYGTERSDAEETESKEGEERYSGDAFPSYFT